MYYDEPLYFEDEHFNDLFDSIKALFDSSNNNSCYVSRDGYLEKKLSFEGVETDFHDENYMSILTKLMVKKMKGLSIFKITKKVCVFLYNGEKVEMKQYSDYRGNEIIFLFTRLNEELRDTSSSCEEYNENNYTEKIASLIKSLYDGSDKYIYKNFCGDFETDVLIKNLCIVDENDDDDEYDYETTTNEMILEKLEGLELKEEGRLITIFKYKDCEIVMCQYFAIDYDGVYFQLIMHKKT